jgi:FkbM family methyltransferase
MKLHEPSTLKKLAQVTAGPLSTILTSGLLYKTTRYIEAYLAFLLGKGGGGSDWNLDHEVKAALQNIFRANPVVFDVGANVGNWSKKFLELQPYATIFQFEPSEACQIEIQKLNIPKSTLIPCAVGREEGSATLYASAPIDGIASLYKRRDSAFKDLIYQEYSVPVTTIDRVIASHSIEFIDFLKMDIEGHELDALKGAATSLSQNKIGALSFEFGCSDINSRTFFLDFWNLLKEKGFQIYRITPAGKLLEIKEYYEDLEYFRGASNYVARLTNHPYA